MNGLGLHGSCIIMGKYVGKEAIESCMWLTRADARLWSEKDTAVTGGCRMLPSEGFLAEGEMGKMGSVSETWLIVKKQL